MNTPTLPKPPRLNFTAHLTLLVAVALVGAVLLGYFYPATAIGTKWMGDWFIAIIKVFIPFVIFFTIVPGISGMSNLKKVGRIGIKSLLYFEVITTISLAIGILLALFIQPGKIDKSGLPIQDASKYTKGAAHINWKEFFLSNLTLQVLVLAIIVGIIVSLSRRREKILAYMEPVTQWIFWLLKIVMLLAPLGAFGGMASTIGKYGIRTLVPLGKLMLTMYGTMAIFIVVVLGLILRYFKLSIFTYLKNIKEEILIVLGTSSSEAALPSLMNKLEKMGCSRSVVGLVVPTGYSFNLDGTSIYLSMAAIFLAQLYNVQLTTGEMLTILGILMVTSKGAAGVTGSGFTVLASTLTAIQKIPVEGLAVLLAVDKFMSEARAITNIIGNGVATLVISKSEKEFNEKTLEIQG
ncbi:cation:dicarboxylase symporter family transporter [Flavitalea sp. BT771]|uniref:cation:dicarboxylate symporter family transporter n=1 Tax=Flavitalea sp. BT771 TaxID=3063329 RepID=UPI0026E1C611|nr:cation:dicarboxylase symporter family transporter [Flavitalea sp. BT771]MDO6429879.1 cation:dicarboxylase symporter family transporter [Flavitalea sp. BT771]MDV6217993.1 cation:dicarboxylase symporter family transporter [Flavitalea sp. BT771]